MNIVVFPILSLLKDFVPFCVFTTDPYAEAPQETVSDSINLLKGNVFGVVRLSVKNNRALSLCWCLQNEEKSKTGRFGK